MEDQASNALPTTLLHVFQTIILTIEDMARIYKPCVYSLIIKLPRKKLTHHYFKRKLISLWIPTEDLILIDLGHDYYTVKFHKEENINTVLHKGPWFINGFYLSIRKWHSNFVPSEVVETLSAIWIRLLKLPTEYYDHTILSRIGSKLGKLVKTDIFASPTLCGRYAHICNEVIVGVPVKPYIFMDHLMQKILYEEADLLCKLCDCPSSPSRKEPQERIQKIDQAMAESTKKSSTIGDWKIVKFNRWRRTSHNT